jgi:hypothetical protein
MQLHINGSVLPIAQLAPNFLVLKTPTDHPPTDAEVAMSIDGDEDRWAARLADGINAGERKTRISRPNFNGSTVG